MIDLASALRATSLPDLEVVLPASGRTVSIARFLRIEVRADSPIERKSSWWAPNKPAILLDGERTWAEFVLVRVLGLEAALEVGVSSSCFAVVEYDAGRPLQRPAPGFGGAS